MILKRITYNAALNAVALAAGMFVYSQYLGFENPSKGLTVFVGLLIVMSLILGASALLQLAKNLRTGN